MKFIYRYLIRQYQTRISPHKGYRCAYSLEHGGSGCSGAVLSILESKGLIGGFADIRGRFSSCKQASIVRLSRENEKERERRKKKDKGCDNFIPGGDCSGFAGCLPSKKGCNIDICDAGDCFSGASCSSITLKTLVLIALGNNAKSK